MALQRAKPPTPWPVFLRQDVRVRGQFPAHDQRQDADCQTLSDVTEDRFVTWSITSEYSDGAFLLPTPGGQCLPTTLQESRQLAQAVAASNGTDVDTMWSPLSFSPYAFDMQINRRDGQRPVAPDWNPREEFLRIARTALIPSGRTSYLRSPDLDEVWGTVPGRSEPAQLPQDVEDVESDAWSLFDREPQNESAEP